MQSPSAPIPKRPKDPALTTFIITMWNAQRVVKLAIPTVRGVCSI